MFIDYNIIHMSEEQTPGFRERHALKMHCIISPQLYVAGALLLTDLVIHVICEQV